MVVWHNETPDTGAISAHCCGARGCPSADLTLLDYHDPRLCIMFSSLCDGKDKDSVLPIDTEYSARLEWYGCDREELQGGDLHGLKGCRCQTHRRTNL